MLPNTDLAAAALELQFAQGNFSAANVSGLAQATAGGLASPTLTLASLVALELPGELFGRAGLVLSSPGAPETELIIEPAFFTVRCQMLCHGAHCWAAATAAGCCHVCCHGQHFGRPAPALPAWRLIHRLCNTLMMLSS
jgi:hypothetical protein